MNTGRTKLIILLSVSTEATFVIIPNEPPEGVINQTQAPVLQDAAEDLSYSKRK